jgi:hypothetical protein
MSEHRDAPDEKAEEKNPRAEQDPPVEDLDVPNDEGENVKGGISLNYSKIHVE